jgi:hypothetical protein
MVEMGLSSVWRRSGPESPYFLHHGNKKTDVAEHPQVLDHVGLLANGLPSAAGPPFI